MAIPDYQALMLPVLALASQGETRVGDAVESLGHQLGLTPEERAELVPSGKQAVFANRVHWAKTYLVKAGLLEITRRGHFRITERGMGTLATHPERIDNSFLERFEAFQQFKNRERPPRNKSAGDEGDAGGADAGGADLYRKTETPDEIIRAAHRQIEAALAQDLLDRICAAPPAFFERLIVELLLAMGYGGAVPAAGRRLGQSGDDGVDGVIDQDALGLDRVYIQAKRYAAGNAIGSGAIRDFFGSLDRHKAAKGLFVTTSAFTSSARETAEYLSKRIVLIDGQRLAQLMIDNNVGCRVADTLHIRKIDEDFFE